MFDACSWAQSIITGALLPIYAATPVDIRICERGRDASTGLCARLGAPKPGELCEAVKGCAYIGSASGSGTSICFDMGKAFYDEAVERILTHPAPAVPEDSSRLGDAALLRALMLARKGGLGCPEDAEVMRLMWLAFGIVGFVDRGDTGRLIQRVRTVSQLTLRLGASRSVAERNTLFDLFGGAVGALARLLSFGMSYQEVE